MIRSKDSNWIVTIDKKSSLKTKNLDFKSFDITLEWKNQKDALYNLKDIDTQMKDMNYSKALTAGDVHTIFKNFLESGKWDFTPYRDSPPFSANTVQVKPIIDISMTGQGVTRSSKLGDTWNIIITFIYKIDWVWSTLII